MRKNEAERQTFINLSFKIFRVCVNWDKMALIRNRFARLTPELGDYEVVAIHANLLAALVKGNVQAPNS